MKKKIVSLVLVFAMALALGIGGTVAWLTAKTDSVVNTFTVGDINIELKETTGNEYKMVPGSTIAKNPTITVLANSEACWLFVKIDETNDVDTFLNYSIASGWTALDSVDGVYYRKVDATTAATPFAVLDGDKVTVKDSVTKDTLLAKFGQKEEDGSYKKLSDGNYDYDETKYPKLTFTAYAIQQANIGSVGAEEAANAVAAWTALNAQ